MRPPTEPELLTSAQAAHLLSCSRKRLRYWDAMGYLPAPVRIGGGVNRWRRAELLDWVAGGCVDRDKWRATGWRPSVPVKLDSLIAAKRAQLEAATDELKDLVALLERGETTVNVRRE